MLQMLYNIMSERYINTPKGDFDMSILEGKKVIHFIGCGGSGMFPIIQILHGKGYTITGSDVNEGDIINYERNMGIKV